MGLYDIYETLNKIDMCDNAYDFSTDYLGKSKSYYSVMKAKEKEASIDSILWLESVLREKIRDYSKFDYQRYKEKKCELINLHKQANQLSKNYRIAKGIDEEDGYDDEIS
jgi:hypothetical protein